MGDVWDMRIQETGQALLQLIRESEVRERRRTMGCRRHIGHVKKTEVNLATVERPPRASL